MIKPVQTHANEYKVQTLVLFNMKLLHIQMSDAVYDVKMNHIPSSAIFEF